MLIALPPVDPGEPSREIETGRAAVGRRVSVVKLTPAGKRLVRDMLRTPFEDGEGVDARPHAREQDSLGRICRKVREDGVVQFVREIRMEEPED